MKCKAGCFERACSLSVAAQAYRLSSGEPDFSGAPVRRGNQNTVLGGAYGRGHRRVPLLRIGFLDKWF
ncbi:hypothetical protein FOFC_17947 [Fusarium oxysporum]|nr:hypothetical protein FOFC_17947 [Fusarium oxysporum]